MTEPLIHRDQPLPEILIVVRLGAQTLRDEHLERSAAECHGRWGIWGFSVLEVPCGDYRRLAHLRPVVARRRLLFVADGADVVAAGFPLLPTLDHPHWTLTMSEVSTRQFERVRGVFQGPGREPSLGASGSRDTLNAMAGPAPYDLWYDPNGVGGDLVVECWISHGPRAGDSSFDPQPGDVVRAGDDEDEPLQARVTRRETNRVWIQLHLVTAAESVV